MSKPRKSSSASRSSRPTTTTQRWRSPASVPPDTRSRSANLPATHERTALQKHLTKGNENGGKQPKRQEHHQESHEEGGIAPPPARERGGRGKRRARDDCQDAGSGSRPGRAAPCDHQSQRASPLAETLVRDARVCQGRQGRLLLPKRAEVQDEIRDVRLHARGEPRRRC